METSPEAQPSEVAPEVAAQPEGADDAPIQGDPVVEVRTLRAKNRILRAERTAIAGRKYVLETVVETLRQKLDELARAFKTIEGGGDVAEALKTVGSLIGDTRRIAEDKEALEGELDAERQERLQERRAREAREFELEERAAGLAAERQVLGERLQSLELRVSELQASGTAGEDAKRQLAAATAELATAANELERAANEAEARARELAQVREAHAQATKERDTLSAELDAIRGSSDELIKARNEAAEFQARAELAEKEKESLAAEVASLKAAVTANADSARAEQTQAIEALQLELEHARSERDALNRSLIAAQAEHTRSLEQALEHGSKSSENDRKLREELAGTLEQERAHMREALAAAEEKRAALETQVTQLGSEKGFLETKLADGGKVAQDLAAAKKELADQKPVLDALTDRVDELEKECNKLSSRLGETRDRGRVDVKELLIRAAVLKRRQEREAQEAASKPLTRAPSKPLGPAPKATGLLGKPAAPKPGAPKPPLS